MALSLLQFARGAVNRQNQINADRRDEANKRKLENMAFAKEAYKLDLDRYARFMEAKDRLAMTGSDGFAYSLAENYKYKPGSQAKTDFINTIKKQTNEDPEFMNKVLRAYGSIKKPNPEDYFKNNEYDKMVEERIQHQDAISRLLFAGRKGPPMLTTAQMKAREKELLQATGGKDFTKGFAEQMQGLIPKGRVSESVATPPEKMSAEQAMVWYAVNDQALPPRIQSYLDKKSNKDSDKPLHTTLPYTDESGAQTSEIVAYKIKDGKIQILDRSTAGQKKPPAMAPIAGKEEKSRALRFLNSAADKNPTLSDLMDSAKSKDEDAMRTLISLRDAVVDRALTLRKTDRESEFGDLVSKAWDQMSKGLTIKDGAPTWAPDLIKPLFKKPSFEKPSSSSGQNMPQVGEVINGYEFKGGNPNDKNSWEKVQ